MERRKLVCGAVRVLRPTERDVYDTYFDTRVGDWGLSTIIGSGRASVNCEWMLVRSDHDLRSVKSENEPGKSLGKRLSVRSVS